MENIKEQNLLKIRDVLLKLVIATKSDGQKVVVGAMTSLLCDAGIPEKSAFRLAHALWDEANSIGTNA